ncbi:hypothetical protein [Bizionia algoritergicola]|uniref:SGNH/GDSL hydrolase family protein n=1 Tax=Bizionia algoritergicola TaxID=291187 RepID=A0A5D0R0M1_9FLAO|nr:hypothetical protein [Bizionia algoritergicola]TYB75072.1 hypothetical protein ES675_02765 [Bizionia algoritergicola]
MKKFVISFAILVVLFLITFNHFNKVFASKNHFVNTTEDFKILAKKTDIDIIFYGSSHAYTAYNPHIINEKCNVISYNLGSDGLRLSLTDLVLEESLKYTKPKLVILEVYGGSLTFPSTDKAKGYQLRALDFVSNFNFSKYSEISKIYNKSEYLGVLFPLFRNHKEWSSVDFFSYDKREEIDTDKGLYYSGFLGYNNIISKSKGRLKYKNFTKQKIKRDSTKTMLSNSSKKELLDFIEIANKNNIKVLIISSPDLRSNYNYYNLFDELNMFCNQLDIPFLNLNEYYKELNLNLDDFKDPGHLNIVGSVKASNFLANYINSNYTFDDRSNEQVWLNEIETLKDNTFLKKHIKLANSFPIQNQEELVISILKQGNSLKKRHEFLNGLPINGLTLFSNNKNDFVIFECEEGFNKEILDDKAFGIHKVVFEKDFELRPERFKKKNSNFISDKSYVDFITYNGKQYILLTFQKNTQIKEFKTIKLFLVNKDEFNGIIGKKLIIKELNF